ncbi:hypothetical protein VCRA2123O444_20395 [Vibrio crassostreae]|nr:hypothetical protein VCRA2118O429_10031 [Vibrio crassostreae]CAK1961307.1 hypothetical protein VCRA2113O416_20031 [Vibrio crassostreae]CAK1967437.1 hypothetical protein VCRA2117O428_20031 [Vibrio crassostreae]CAK1969279.1 hypothetical protein VCRA2119O430_20031 [Vibrio crassostreae]CAK2004078.1 hypothetical protein VCRA2114O422_20395 [Vibrio crassostreae]
MFFNLPDANFSYLSSNLISKGQHTLGKPPKQKLLHLLGYHACS